MDLPNKEETIEGLKEFVEKIRTGSEQEVKELLKQAAYGARYIKGYIEETKRQARQIEVSMGQMHFKGNIDLLQATLGIIMGYEIPVVSTEPGIEYEDETEGVTKEDVDVSVGRSYQ